MAVDKVYWLARVARFAPAAPVGGLASVFRARTTASLISANYAAGRAAGVWAWGAMRKACVNPGGGGFAAVGQTLEPATGLRHGLGTTRSSRWGARLQGKKRAAAGAPARRARLQRAHTSELPPRERCMSC